MVMERHRSKAKDPGQRVRTEMGGFDRLSIIEITRRELAKRVVQEQTDERILGMVGRSHSLWPTISV